MKYLMLAAVLLLTSCEKPASVLEAAASQHDTLEIIGVYVDSTSFPYGTPEIILYKQNDELGGTWSFGYPNPQNFKRYPYEILPLENIRIAPNGDLTFSILWGMTRRTGHEKMFHHFVGQLQEGVMQGSFTSDWSSLRPSPIKAFKQAPADLKSDIHEYVTARQRSATEYKKKLDELINCQTARNHPPDSPIEVIGKWSKVDSDGEHEWGYEIVLFRFGNTYQGWIEDFSGLIGDGGIRYPLYDVQFEQKNLSFQIHPDDFVVTYKTIIQGSILNLKNEGRISLLEKIDSPTTEEIWPQYQALKIKCE